MWTGAERATEEPVPGSTAATASSDVPPTATQTAPKPAAMPRGVLPIVTVATALFEAGSTRVTVP